ncbi:MAG: transcriptional regulator FilR1 domain-containing protein [Halobacteriales archaeon]|nr:transcriptional regulator FilR1 domain-containing protein [Halobacteriales archaeon]
MTTDPSLIDYVIGSSVRRAVLRRIGRNKQSTASLLESLEASESAIYDALSELAAVDLIDQEENGETWYLTGAGRIVLDRIRVQNRTNQLLEIDRAYWRNHRIDVLPASYRRELHVLNDAEVLRATGLDPNGPIREVADTIETADRIDLAAVVYNQRIGEAFLQSTADKRLVLNTTLVEEFLLEEGEEDLTQLKAAVRVTDVSTAIALTDNTAFVSLPPRDGLFDPQAVLQSESETGREWARRLFDYLWRDGMPITEYLAQ